jgi:Putative auto-transporter adhesin, head GIN domain
MHKILFLVPLFALSACGYSASDAIKDIKKMEISSSDDDLEKGKAITAQAADPGAFTALATIGADAVIFKIGDAYTVSATGSAKALENLRFVVNNGELKVGRYKQNWNGGDDTAVITITAPALSGLSVAGSGKVNAERISGAKVSISTAGSGTIDVADVETPNLDTSIAGSGRISLAGKVADASYDIAGSGSIDAAKMASTSAKVSIAGSGDAKLTASGKVNADIAGSGTVNVSGGATCTSSVTGSGSLNCG